MTKYGDDIDVEIWGALNALEAIVSQFFVGIFVGTEDPVAAAREHFEGVKRVARKSAPSDPTETERAVLAKQEEAIDRMLKHLLATFRELERRSGHA